MFEHGTTGIGGSARRLRRGLRAGLIAAAVATALIQIGPPRAGATDAAVTIKTFQFAPAQLQVAAGTYDYFCMRHNFMHGSVVVR